MRFPGFLQLCLFLSYVNQTPKSNLSPIYYQKNVHEEKSSKETNNLEYGTFKFHW